MTPSSSPFAFPLLVDERASRLTASGVCLMAIAFISARSGWILVPLCYGFVARALVGPRFSPLSRFVSGALIPRIGPGRKVPGRPKRFAQRLGLGFSGVAAAAWLAGAHTLAVTAISLLLVAAGLEAAFGICLGCIVYRFFWECEDCSAIGERLQHAISDGRPAPAFDRHLEAVRVPATTGRRSTTPPRQA